jgi:hypothetical protein
VTVRGDWWDGEIVDERGERHSVRSLAEVVVAWADRHPEELGNVETKLPDKTITIPKRRDNEIIDLAFKDAFCR